MAENSKIEWCDATWNCLAGCSIVSPGCHHCYAMHMAARLEAMGQAKYAGTTKKAKGKTLWTGKINLDEKALEIPLKKKKPTRYFVNSMSDLFHDDVPEAFIDRCFAVMALCPQHTFQVLTKRVDRMRAYFADSATEDRIDEIACDEGHKRDLGLGAKEGDLLQSEDWVRFGRGGYVELPLPNVWLGVSVEDQQRADERIPLLLETRAAVRFLSVEPLLGSVQLSVAWTFVGALTIRSRPARLTGSSSAAKVAPVPVPCTQTGRVLCEINALPQKCRSFSSNMESGSSMGKLVQTSGRVPIRATTRFGGSLVVVHLMGASLQPHILGMAKRG
jgi:protein gp37